MPNQNVNKNIFEGSDWNEYSDFEFMWVETMLNRIIKRSDVVHLFKKFGIKFTEKQHIKAAAQEEIGNIIINDIKKDDLLPLIKDTVKEKYPYLLSFEECEEIYNDLIKKDKSALVKIYLTISQNEDIKYLITQPQFINENKEKHLVGFIIGELYKLPKETAKIKLKKIKEEKNGIKHENSENNFKANG